MRPISLEFQAFGPYKGHEVIDFCDLSSKGLFLICGETGSGKTMILDAMTFALYGKSSGSTRDSLADLRCNRCDDSVETFVSFTFENNGEVYRFERRREKKRINYSETQNVFVRDENGVFAPLFENCKKTDVDAKAAEIIGLDYNQFSQVIILPQGKFEKLLTSDSDSKEKILATIFGAGKWKRIAECFYAIADEAKRKSDDLRKEIDFILNKENCGNLEELDAAIAGAQETVVKSKEALKELNYDEQIRKLGSLRVTAEKFKKLDTDTARLDSLKGRRSLFDAKRVELADAERASRVKDAINALKASDTEEVRRKSRKAQADADLAKKKKAQELSALELDGHKAKESEYKSCGERLLLIASSESLYANLDNIEKEYNDAKKAHKDAEAAEKKSSEAYEKCARRQEAALEEFRKAVAFHSEILDRYVKGIAGELADSLNEGDVCPVCGNTHHPNPAKKLPESVSRAEVDEAGEKASECEKKLKDAEAKCAEAEKAKKLADSDEAEKLIAETKAEEKYKASKANLLEGIASHAELIAKREECESFIRTYEETLENLSKKAENDSRAVTESTAFVASCESEYAEAVSKKKEAESELSLKLVENGFSDRAAAESKLKSDEECSAMVKQIADYEASVKELETTVEAERKELERCERPDTGSIDAQIKELGARKDSFTGAVSTAEAEQLRLSSVKAEVLKKSEAYALSAGQAEKDMIFAKSFRGDSGVGFERYVLSIMFSSVIVEANRMLEKVHGGRYRLKTTTGKISGSNKRGLDLIVMDSYSPDGKGRLVSTLSGGEKFLASLALSIGMSTIAKSGGVNIEAMFIDEGFGSLDENSIEDALDVLNSIRRANGTVGIISHVQVLSDNIPTKVSVTKSVDSSKINVSIG